MGIYKVTNKINNKMYIGSSKNITGRWNYHIDDLFENKHHSYKLQKEFNEFGICCFTFEIIEIVKNKVELLDIEQDWMDYYLCYEDDIGYNVSISSKEKKTKLDLKIELDKIERKKTIKETIIIKNKFIDNKNEIIKAIANRDVRFLKEKINLKHTYYKSISDCFNEIYQYNFKWFFDSSDCILNGGDSGFEICKVDKTYKFIFKKDNREIDILYIIMLVGKFKNEPYKFINFLLEIFNMSISR